MIVEYDPFRPPDRDCPWPALARIRAESPAAWSDVVGAWLVTRYADVQAVAADPGRFSSADTTTPLSLPAPVRAVLERDPASSQARPMVATDPPRHTRLRRITGQAVARRVAAIEPFVRAEASRLCDRLADDDHCDLVAAFAGPLPVAVIAHLQGIPAADHDRVRAWSDDLVALQWGHLPVAEHVAVAERVVAFHAYMTDLVEAKRRSPGADVISDLVAGLNDGELAIEELVRQMSGLLVAGHETTTNLIAHAVLHLSRTPGAWAALATDPAAAALVVEETLRVESSVLGMMRVTASDVEVSGVRIAAGQRVQVLFGAAGRDPAVYARPDEFDPWRRHERPHLAFGHGRHFCVGATLARLELRVALELLARRLPGLSLVDGAQVRFKPNAAFRGPESLEVSWERAA